ncbi:MAG TPA: hypothetical protein VFT68_15540 [Lapillicoccus sp.]|nr:hypothetical protein [Lapillicoccus sp.]
MPDRDERPATMPDRARVLPVTPAEPPVKGVAGTATAHTPLADTTPPDVEPPPRNYLLLLGQGASYGLAGKLASTNVVLPFLCAALGGSLLVAGLLDPLNTLGSLVGFSVAPAVLSTRMASRVVLALMDIAAGALLFVLAGVSLALPDRGLAVDIVFVAVAFGSGVTSGIGIVAFTDILARGIHHDRRSTLLLTQAAIGGALASVVAIATTWLFASRDPIVGHISLMWFAGGFLVLAGVFTFSVGVEHVPIEGGKRRSLVTTLKDGAAAARRYAWLRQYLTRQILFLSVALATTFFSIRVAALHGSVPGSLAVLIAVASTALVAGALLWKRVLKSRGYRGMLVGGTLCSTLAAAGAVTVERLGLVGSPFVHAVFILLATLAADAVSVAKSAYLVEHAAPAELPELSAFTQLVIGLASAVVAAVIATLAQVHGTVWPAAILLGLNIIAVVAASRTPRPPSRGGSG